MKLFWISCYLGLFHLKIERGMNVNFCIWGSRKCHFLYIWGSWKWNFDLYGGLENAIFVYGVSAMPFCCVWVSRKCHFVVYGVSKFPFCCIWGLENAILLYVVSKMPFYCMWVIFVWGGAQILFIGQILKKNLSGVQILCMEVKFWPFIWWGVLILAIFERHLAILTKFWAFFMSGSKFWPFLVGGGVEILAFFVWGGQNGKSVVYGGLKNAIVKQCK